MYKVPHRLVAIVAHPANATVLEKLYDWGCDDFSVGDLLSVKYRGRIYISTYYLVENRREAEMDAAKNGFPFVASPMGRPYKVGLLARMYRAIIA